MVNFGLNSASILGIFLAVAGAGLYFLRTIRPELSRDHDIFFAAVGLLCGFILLFQGWRLDPILQFGQFLLAGTTIFFAVETIRLRGAATEQARRNTPIVDEDRPVSRSYREARVYRETELDEIEPYPEPRYEKRRLRGYEEPRPPRKNSYDSNERNERRVRNRSSEDSYDTREKPRRPRPNRPSSERYTDSYGDWEQSADSWSESTSSNRPRRPRDEDIPEANPKPRKRRPRPSTQVTSSVPEDSSYTDYVDYQPIEKSNSNSSDSQDRNDVRPRQPDWDDSEDYRDYELGSSEY